VKPPEVTQESLEKIQRGNQRRLSDFQAQGVAINIPSAPGPLVELLIEAVAGPQGSPEWLAFIYAYEVKIRDMLDGHRAPSRPGEADGPRTGSQRQPPAGPEDLSL
jgi:hypothetical protein